MNIVIEEDNLSMQGSVLILRHNIFLFLNCTSVFMTDLFILAVNIN